MGKTKASTKIITHARHSNSIELPAVCPECGNVKTKLVKPTFEDHLFFTKIKYITDVHCECGCYFEMKIEDRERKSLRAVVGGTILGAGMLSIIATIIFIIISDLLTSATDFAIISFLVGIVLFIAGGITLSED